MMMNHSSSSGDGDDDEHSCCEDSRLCIMMYAKRPITTRNPSLKFPHDAATFFGQDKSFLSKVERMAKLQENQDVDMHFSFNMQDA